MEQINISIRNMVEFVYRSGNIDTGYMSAQRAVDGIRIHKKIQAMRKAEARKDGSIYESEYSLRLEFNYKDTIFKTDGRADGLFICDNEVSIEEIKSTTMDLAYIESNPSHWHWAQAKCYAYMYCENFASAKININLTYCNVETMEQKSLGQTFTKEELREFFYGTIELYYVFAKASAQCKEIRNQTVKPLPFPFGAYRKGQRELAVSVYAALKSGKNLFAHAPTGIGKTVSTLYPAIKALETGLVDKIFYLTSRNTGRITAANCLGLLEEKGLVMVSLSLNAKTKICVLDEPKCNPIDCPRALGHFDRVNNAILDIISSEHMINKEITQYYATKHNVCPFEMQLDLSLFADCIICDYNYVYDPVAKLKRFFSGDTKNNFALLIDEAHNLADRAREMFSVNLEYSDLKIIQGLFEGKKHPLKAAVIKVLKIIEEIAQDVLGTDKPKEAFHALPDSLYYSLTALQKEIDVWLATEAGHDSFGQMLDIYFRILDFQRILEIYDDSFITIINKYRQTLDLRIICLDPSPQITTANKLIKCAVYFSATLRPLDFFMKTLGGTDGDFKLLISSPFKRENLCVLANTAISTKYKDREVTYESISHMIYAAVSSKKGNYIAFFPSYVYMEKVMGDFSVKYAHVNTTAQIQGDNSGGFLNSFKEDNIETLLGFAVLGAGYSEGIDLAGDLLIGVIIIGVGLPMISLERDVIKDYYDEKISDGYGFSYKYPGMNKIMQAGGRVIRKEDDRGFILLIDSRYGYSEYISLMPTEWTGFSKVQSAQAVSNRLNSFWQ